MYRRQTAQRTALLLMLTLCAVPIDRAIAQPAAAQPNRAIDFAMNIGSEEVWRQLNIRPNSQHLSNSEVVKFIVDRSDGMVYFLQSERWPIHNTFARRFLSTPQRPIPDPAAFNAREYHSKDRRFVLGQLVRYRDSDVFAMELFAGDELDLDDTARAFFQLKRLVYFGDKLRYRPVPAAQERELDRARTLMPIITTNELFGKVRYQPLELGEAYGYLRVYPRGTPLDSSALRPFDIVVLAELPEDLPVVAGVISEQLQAPLGHINVLCHNRGTPNLAVRDIIEDPRVKTMHDQLVHLIVEGQSFKLEAATQAAAERSWERKRPQKSAVPARDDRDLGMPLLSEKRARSVAVAGAKASQLAMIAARLPAGVVPRGFVLPFHAYAKFLSANGFDRRIATMLRDAEFLRSPQRRRQVLDALRADMERATVPPDILHALSARLREVLPPGAVRFRSSTNAEDLPGFNGAGLYRSTRVADPRNEAEIATALKQVWSSVWLWGAFEERQFYRLDHSRVAMAVLIHQSIDDIAASGVAITANPFNQGQPGMFINAQVAQGSVTGARGDEVPEQVLYYAFEDTNGFERLSYSSRSPNRPLLSDAAVKELVAHLLAVQVAFTGYGIGLGSEAVDVEFLIGQSGKIHIVQARPYTQTWSGDRRWTWNPGPSPINASAPQNP